MNDLDYMKPIKMKSASDIVVDRLTDAIISGQIKPGDKIPTEPELAASFCVGRNTVREAVRTLVAYGILEIRRPEGTFVCKTFKPHSMNPLIYSMILKQKESYQDLIGLRECIDFGTHQVIMEQGLQPDDAAKLREIATSIQEELDAPNPDAKLICQTDIAFHDAIARATHNELIVIINDMLSKLTYGSRIKTIEHCIATNDRKYLVDIHFEMLRILEEGNTDALPSTLKHSYSYWANLQMEE
jgi:GntR family transcriptional regulator, transcriptional repressor for pyruvate dehydrogenase complex